MTRERFNQRRKEIKRQANKEKKRLEKKGPTNSRSLACLW
jgi:hypothetical protein